MRKNECVVIIPAYEPSRSFVEYAKRLVNAHIAKLIVVNDGSGKRYQPVYDEIKALPRTEVLSYENNCGKGHALKVAFKYAKENFDERYTFVTVDCDGQHLEKDVFNVASAAAEFGDSMVLGVRDFSQPSVPKRSRLGNVSTRRAFRLLYGVRVSDTQTGLRAFPYALLDSLINIKGDRFEYEMNQLVLLHKRDVPIREVPIATVYGTKPDDVERISHYNTVKDSLRVAKVLLTNLSFFILANTISAVIELLLGYFGLIYFPEAGLWNISRAVCAQFTARFCSSIVNFIFNYKFVFNGHSKRSIFRYYLLWLGLFASSLGFAHLFGKLLESPFWIVFCTGCSTVVMSLFSYQIQTRWVFAGGKRKNGKFWGLYSRMVRFLYRLFSKRYTSLVARDPLGAVYVCRHLNMHGPYTTAAKLGFDTHMMAFSVFCKWKDAFRHFRDVNCIQQRNMNKFSATICGFLFATFVVPLTRSMDAIPVYRNNAQSIITLKRAMKYLEMHENIILYPDVSYTADSKTETDIYSGFLLIDRMYYKKFGKHIRFIPLCIDEENRTIVEKPPIRFKNGDYKKQSEIVKEKIMRAIGCVNENSVFLEKLREEEKEEDVAEQISEKNDLLVPLKANVQDAENMTVAE